MPDPDEKPWFQKWLTQGVLLAAAPAVAYVLAFFYESGFAAHFHIPSHLVEVRLPSLCIAGLTLLAYLASLPIHARFYGIVFKNRMSPSLVVLTVMSLLVFSCAMMAYVAARFWIYWVLLAVILMLLAYWEDRVKRKAKTKPPGEAHDGGTRASDTPPSLTESIVYGRPRVSTVATVLAAALVLPMAYLVGQVTAVWGRTYAVVRESNRDMVVLRIYGDSLICAPLERGTQNKVRPCFTVLRLTGGRNPSLRIEKFDHGLIPIEPAGESEDTPPPAAPPPSTPATVP